MPDFLIYAIPTVFVFALLLIFLAWNRWMAYRETIQLIEHGSLRDTGRSKPSRTLLWGLLLTGFGLALCIGLYPVSAGNVHDTILGFGPVMLGGLLPLFAGLSLILFWRIDRDDARRTSAGGERTWEGFALDQRADRSIFGTGAGLEVEVESAESMETEMEGG